MLPYYGTWKIHNITTFMVVDNESTKENISLRSNKKGKVVKTQKLEFG
jgi:hypothetical protein